MLVADLVMLGIGEFAVKQGKSAKATPVNFWYYPEFGNRLETSSLYTENMVDFMEEELGTPYPWGSYSQVMVQDFIYGAMENTTATVFGDFFNVDLQKIVKNEFEILFDGAINEETVAEIKNAGVDIFCVGSFLTERDFTENLKYLKKAIS